MEPGHDVCDVEGKLGALGGWVFLYLYAYRDRYLPVEDLIDDGKEDRGNKHVYDVHLCWMVDFQIENIINYQIFGFV